MRRLSFGVLLIALSTLVLELMLTRVFDVTLTPNLSYFVVSLAVFSFGLAGIYATLRPIPVETDIRGRLVGCCVGFAGSGAASAPRHQRSAARLPAHRQGTGHDPRLLRAPCI